MRIDHERRMSPASASLDFAGVLPILKSTLAVVYNQGRHFICMSDVEAHHAAKLIWRISSPRRRRLADVRPGDPHNAHSSRKIIRRLIVAYFIDAAASLTHQLRIVMPLRRSVWHFIMSLFASSSSRFVMAFHLAMTRAPQLFKPEKRNRGR